MFSQFAMLQSKGQSRCFWYVLAIVVCLLLPQNGLASGLETFAQALTRYHIELSKPALIEALQNPNEGVRGLAAWQLLEEKADDTLPQILQAVRDERNPGTKVNLAAAAAAFGSKEGAAALAALCHDSALPGYVRTDAARHLVHDEKDRSCVADLITMMASAADPETRVQTMNMLSQMTHLTEFESAEVLRYTLEALREPDLSLRLNAISALTALRDRKAIPYLRAAVQVEQDQTIRLQMNASLETLLAVKPAP